MANVPKYVPPHARRAAATTQEKPKPQRREFAPLPLRTKSLSRWQGERPSPSRSSFSPLPTSRPSSSGSSHGGPAALLQAHGDSFVGPLKLLDRVVDVHRYSGATAKGLSNDKSEQQVGRRIIECLDKTRPDKVLLQFGNVDINISSVYRLERSGAEVWDEEKFVAGVWELFEAFLRRRILPRLEKQSESSSATLATSPDNDDDDHSHPPGYIRQLYICKATLPVVADDALPESHAKYQYPKKGDGAPERSAEDEERLGTAAAKCADRVRPLVSLCGLDARRRMTADFNARLVEFVAKVEADRQAEAVHAVKAIYVVDLNKYIGTTPCSDEVAAPYVTNDPTNLHLVWETTLPFWIKELDPTGIRPYDMPTQGQLQEQLNEYASRKEDQMKVMKERRSRNRSSWGFSPAPSPIYDGSGLQRWPEDGGINRDA